MNLDKEYNSLFSFLTISTLSVPELLNEKEDPASLTMLEKKARIENLKSLCLLEPFENKISEFIHYAINLEVLCIRGYKCRDLPSEIGLLENLKILSIEGIDMKIIPSWFYSLKKIEKLILCFTSIKMLHKNIFTENSLEYLQVFQDEKIDYIDFDIFLLKKVKECFISISDNFYLELLNSDILDSFLKGFVFSNCVLKKGIDSPKTSLNVFSMEIDKSEMKSIFSNKNKGKMILKLDLFGQINKLMKSSQSENYVNVKNKDIVFNRLILKAEKLNIRMPEYLYDIENEIFEKYIDSKFHNRPLELKMIYDNNIFDKINFLNSLEVKNDYLEILKQLYNIQIEESLLFNIIGNIKSKVQKNDENWKFIFPIETNYKHFLEGGFWKVMKKYDFEKIYMEKKELFDKCFHSYELEIIKMKIFYFGSIVDYKGANKSVSELLSTDHQFIIDLIITKFDFILDRDLMFNKVIRESKFAPKVFEINMTKLEIIKRWGLMQKGYIEEKVNNYYENYSPSLDDCYLDGGGGNEWSDPSDFWD
jgi:hypothetical protein